MDKSLQDYKYQRKCRLARCNKDFGTNRKKQLFCLDLHRIEYHEVKRKKERFFSTKLKKLEKELNELSEKKASGLEIYAAVTRCLVTLGAAIMGSPPADSAGGIVIKAGGEIVKEKTAKKGGDAREKKKPPNR